MLLKSRFSLCALLLALATLGAPSAVAQTPEASESAHRRVKVPESVAASLVAEQSPVKYPEAARNAGLQGVVVLKVAISVVGDVKEVSVVSGDAALAHAPLIQSSSGNSSRTRSMACLSRWKRWWASIFVSKRRHTQCLP